MSLATMFTDEQLARMFAWRRANKSYTFIANKLKCSKGAVRYQCLLAMVFPVGVPPKTSRYPMSIERDGYSVRRFTAEEDRQLLALDAEDVDTAEICRILDRGRQSVRTRLLTLTMRQLQEQAA